MASGAAATDGSNALLMPLARSEGRGVEDDVAISSNVHIIPTTVAIRQRTASDRATAPVHIIHRVARVRVVAIDASPLWYGFEFGASIVLNRNAIATNVGVQRAAEVDVLVSWPSSDVFVSSHGSPEFLFCYRVPRAETKSMLKADLCTYRRNSIDSLSVASRRHASDLHEQCVFFVDN